jgi:hypothetical protein
MPANINTGYSAEDRRAIASGLVKLLGNLTARLAAHEQNAWMPRSTLGGK